MAGGTTFPADWEVVSVTFNLTGMGDVLALEYACAEKWIGTGMALFPVAVTVWFVPSPQFIVALKLSGFGAVHETVGVMGCPVVTLVALSRNLQFAPTKAWNELEPVLAEPLVPLPCTTNTPEAGNVVPPPIPLP
jgi:hypothetical protein